MRNPADRCPVQKLQNRIIIACLILSAPSIFLIGTAGNPVNFLPSPEFVRASSEILAVGSLALAALLTLLFYGPVLFGRQRLAEGRSHSNDVFGLMALLCGWGALYSFGISTGPLLLSYVAASRVEITYVVHDPSENARRCKRGVSFESLPFFNDRLCDFASSAPQVLGRCDRVTLRGVGTGFGLRVQEIAERTKAPTGQWTLSRYADCPW